MNTALSPVKNIKNQAIQFAFQAPAGWIVCLAGDFNYCDRKAMPMCK